VVDAILEYRDGRRERVPVAAAIPVLRVVDRAGLERIQRRRFWTIELVETGVPILVFDIVGVADGVAPVYVERAP
jgi:hypothetical protein